MGRNCTWIARRTDCGRILELAHIRSPVPKVPALGPEYDGYLDMGFRSYLHSVGFLEVCMSAYKGSAGAGGQQERVKAAAEARCLVSMKIQAYWPTRFSSLFQLRNFCHSKGETRQVAKE